MVYQHVQKQTKQESSARASWLYQNSWMEDHVSAAKSHKYLKLCIFTTIHCIINHEKHYIEKWCGQWTAIPQCAGRQTWWWCCILQQLLAGNSQSTCHPCCQHSVSQPLTDPQQPVPTHLYQQNMSHLGMWRSSNSNLTTFELQTFSTDSKFVECFKHFVVECEFVGKSLFYDWFLMHSKKLTAAKERTQTFL